MDQPSSVSHPAAGHSPADSQKKRRHLWIWVIILLLFGLLFWWVWRQHSASAAAPAGRGGRGATTAGGACHRRHGNEGQHRRLSRRHRHGHARLHRLHHCAGHRRDHGSALSRRADGAQGRSADRHRCPALRGAACPGAGRAGPRPEPAGRSADGPEALSGCLGQERHSAPDARRPGKDGARRIRER